MPVVLDPDAAAVLKAFRDAGRPRYEDGTPAQAREFYMQARLVSNPEAPGLKAVDDIVVPGPAGDLPARLYTPPKLRGAEGKAPILVFFHGGGWVIGNLETHDVVCRMLALEGEMKVIAIDYRLSPETKFPGAVEDAIAATKWVAASAAKLGIDGAQISVGGDSAGGNLAAVVALDARDKAGPKLNGQMLIYPGTDFRGGHPSHSEPETSCLLTHSVIKWFQEQYLDASHDRTDPRISPGLTPDLARLPPAYVLTCGADPLRDEGDEYAERLKAAGVPVAYKNYPGQFHGFITMGKLLPKAGLALTEIAGWLRGLKAV